jgi:hypothetical protein
MFMLQHAPLFRRVWFGPVALLAGLYVVGCGGGRSDLGLVSGVVILDGQPLGGATVIFQPDSGGPASYGLTDTAGRYRVMYDHGTRGAVIGSHTVRITTFQEGDSDASPPIRRSPEILPARFNRKSTLREEVVAGSNQIDFALESE